MIDPSVQSFCSMPLYCSRVFFSHIVCQIFQPSRGVSSFDQGDDVDQCNPPRNKYYHDLLVVHGIQGLVLCTGGGSITIFFLVHLHDASLHPYKIKSSSDINVIIG
ncbi:hypothetical protein BCR42DRAFT_428907 [Absidia repens]|uniref:Uncharacterized protein n=1 Tax=Absidia repens TaxID=90262 RepID=A0A1X2HXQ2_9FUNG|nr:hypothetical protein BCR42DRAFT_428907 [Absidia repens]